MSTSIYYHLWKEDQNLESCPGILVPETIPYESGLPRSWFYSDGKGANREFKRKLGKDLEVKNIFAGLKAPVHPDLDVVASYMSRSHDDTREVCVEFFGVQELHNFLLRRSEKGNGVLQRLLVPSGGSMSVYQAIWSPHVVLVERRVNQLKFLDLRHPAFDRLVTFEGPSHYSAQMPCPPQLTKKIKEICASIVNHVQNSERVTISRMVLFFRTDSLNNVYFSWCSSLRLDDSAVPLNLSPSYQSAEDMRREMFRKRLIQRSSSSGSLSPEPGSPLSDSGTSLETGKRSPTSGSRAFTRGVSFFATGSPVAGTSSASSSKSSSSSIVPAGSFACLHCEDTFFLPERFDVELPSLVDSILRSYVQQQRRRQDLPIRRLATAASSPSVSADRTMPTSPPAQLSQQHAFVSVADSGFHGAPGSPTLLDMDQGHFMDTSTGDKQRHSPKSAAATAAEIHQRNTIHEDIEELRYQIYSHFMKDRTDYECSLPDSLLLFVPDLETILAKFGVVVSRDAPEAPTGPVRLKFPGGHAAIGRMQKFATELRDTVDQVLSDTAAIKTMVGPSTLHAEESGRGGASRPASVPAHLQQLHAETDRASSATGTASDSAPEAAAGLRHEQRRSVMQRPASACSVSSFSSSVGRGLSADLETAERVSNVFRVHFPGLSMVDIRSKLKRGQIPQCLVGFCQQCFVQFMGSIAARPDLESSLTRVGSAQSPQASGIRGKDPASSPQQRFGNSRFIATPLRRSSLSPKIESPSSPFPVSVPSPSTSTAMRKLG